MGENIAYRWDEFRDWCEDQGVLVDDSSEWRQWRELWDCWKAAIDAKTAHEK